MFGRIVYCFLLISAFSTQIECQDVRDMKFDFEPVQVAGWPGLHSFSYGTYNGNIICVGGRKDGIHARQPFNAFPASQNNSKIYILNVENQVADSINLQAFPESIQIHLQATNHEFYQEGKYLIIVGGYAYSKVEKEHITFPYITILDLEKLLDYNKNKSLDASAIRQIKDKRFAITGGQMGKIDDEYILVGGHKFDGEYNPMNGPTFIQVYTDGLLRFKLDLTGQKIKVIKFTKVTDALHLHRRDFNLVQTDFPDGERGYTLYSGVFQINKELPFLYPVEIRKISHHPKLNFNQYLSNYHCTKFSALVHGKKLTFFLGGISQYYMEGKDIISDELVPFVNTISVMDQESYTEYKLNSVMPDLIGAAGEFVLKTNLNSNVNSMLDLEKWDGKKREIGFIIGGLYSEIDHPFQMNSAQIQSKSSKVIYKVFISQSDSSSLLPVTMNKICTKAKFLKLDKTNGTANISVEFDSKVDLYFTDKIGNIVYSMKDVTLRKGDNNISVSLPKKVKNMYQGMAILNGNEFINLNL